MCINLTQKRTYTIFIHARAYLARKFRINVRMNRNRLKYRGKLRKKNLLPGW